MATESSIYRERTEAEREAASAAVLPNIIARHERAAAGWDRMAERATIGERARQRAAGRDEAWPSEPVP